MTSTPDKQVKQGGGKLCVSVIEARHVQADASSSLSFYVKLRVGACQAKTDMATSVSPKFLKDLRLNVTNPSTDCLTVELLQQGLHGDLVIGKEQLRIASVMDKGTLVSWLPLISMDGECAAEVCIVMRYLQANSSRPMTPSYASAAREAKERALTGQPVDPQDITKQPISSSLFSELPSSTPALMAQPSVQSPGTPTKHAPSIAHVVSSPTTQPNSPAVQGYSNHRAYTGTGQYGQRTAPAARRRAPSVLRAVKHVSTLLSRDAGKQQPVPLAVVCGSVLGVLLYFFKLRKASQVMDPETEAPCAVGACFRQDAYDRYRQRYTAL